MQLLAVREYNPPSMRWLFRVLVIMYVQVGKFAVQDVARAVWGVSVITKDLKYLPSKRWLRAFSGQFESQLGSCGAQELAQGLWGLVKMRHVPSEKFMQTWEARAEAVGWGFALAEAQEGVEAYGILGRAVPAGLGKALAQQEALWEAQEAAARAGVAAALADAAKLQQALLAQEDELMKKAQGTGNGGGPGVGAGKKKLNSSRKYWKGQQKQRADRDDLAAAVKQELLQAGGNVPQLAAAS
jgi:hypothetical protein